LKVFCCDVVVLCFVDISARLQEILINEQKARDELNTRIINGELITGNEIKKINQDTANAKLLIQKELLNKIKELNNTSKQNEFDILAQNLSWANPTEQKLYSIKALSL